MKKDASVLLLTTINIQEFAMSYGRLLPNGDGAAHLNIARPTFN
jgi:hypothetical protein